jgi:hypothetical protein
MQHALRHFERERKPSRNIEYVAERAEKSGALAVRESRISQSRVSDPSLKGNIAPSK